MSRITTTVLLSLALLAALTACQPQPAPEPPAAAGDTQRFWTCLRADHSRYHQRNPIYRFLNPEPSAALAAARHCAAGNLPEYAGDRQPADLAGAQVKDCLDQAMADYAKAQETYPDQPDPRRDNFALQGYNQICYTDQKAAPFGFPNPTPGR